MFKYLSLRKTYEVQDAEKRFHAFVDGMFKFAGNALITGAFRSLAAINHNWPLIIFTVILGLLMFLQCMKVIMNVEIFSEKAPMRGVLSTVLILSIFFLCMAFVLLVCGSLFWAMTQLAIGHGLTQ